jgi:SAM-dependent methyltransferase
MLASRYYRYSIVNTYIEECPNWSSPIIDIGAGDGKVVADLRAAGFANARGIDPYLTESVYDDSGLLVEKAALESVEGTHDVISFHHVLEHLADPLAALRFARARLTAGGKILARVPVTDGELFRIYRENWFQLDAPRHLHIFSRRSLDRLAADAGLRIGRYWCDATEWPYLYSEMYRQGAPLTEAKAYLARQSAASRRALRRRARAANAAGIGDQVSAIFEIVR